ncbi:UNVERIFIED_CONTAM: FT-interacting protein 3 [Sesamum calycinum]|uniref:FT-interacting protein 3 n=1 Tax=Sesamum calycinum TaxID=2727403 RepID=A0AAW2SBF6_9LAMI
MTSLQMEYFYVRVVRAKELPGKDVTGTCVLYVEVKLGNYKGVTKHFEKKSNPEWNLVFAFAQEQLQASHVEVVVKDKDVVLDDFIGKVSFDLVDIPRRVPPDSPGTTVVQAGRQERRKAQEGEIMLALWKGTQADEVFSDAWHSDAAAVGSEGVSKIRGKVYLSPRLWYLRVNVIQCQDLLPSDKSRPPEVCVKVVLGNQALKTKVSSVKSVNPSWNEDLVFVGAEPFEDPLVITVEDRVAPNKDEILGRCVMLLNTVSRRLDNKPVPAKWHNLEKHPLVEGQKKEAKFSSKIHLRISLDGGLSWLSLMKSKDGRGTTDAYCVAKYGPNGVKKMGEVQLAVRFSCTSYLNMLQKYTHPLLPKMHYVHPLSVIQLDVLRYQAIQIVSARLGRAEPPLKKEAIEYMLDVGSHIWSVRKAKANFVRIMNVMSGVVAVAKMV